LGKIQNQLNNLDGKFEIVLMIVYLTHFFHRDMKIPNKPLYQKINPLTNLEEKDLREMVQTAAEIRAQHPNLQMPQLIQVFVNTWKETKKIPIGKLTKRLENRIHVCVQQAVLDFISFKKGPSKIRWNIIFPDSEKQLAMQRKMFQYIRDQEILFEREEVDVDIIGENDDDSIWEIISKKIKTKFKKQVPNMEDKISKYITQDNVQEFHSRQQTAFEVAEIFKPVIAQFISNMTTKQLEELSIKGTRLKIKNLQDLTRLLTNKIPTKLSVYDCKILYPFMIATQLLMIHFNILEFESSPPYNSKWRSQITPTRIEIVYDIAKDALKSNNHALYKLYDDFEKSLKTRKNAKEFGRNMYKTLLSVYKSYKRSEFKFKIQKIAQRKLEVHEFVRAVDEKGNTFQLITYPNRALSVPWQDYQQVIVDQFVRNPPIGMGLRSETPLTGTNLKAACRTVKTFEAKNLGNNVTIRVVKQSDAKQFVDISLSNATRVRAILDEIQDIWDYDPDETTLVKATNREQDLLSNARIRDLNVTDEEIWYAKINPCFDPDKSTGLSTPQKFLKLFFHPRNVFQTGMLLYHSVGAGKTRAAMAILKNFLSTQTTTNMPFKFPRINDEQLPNEKCDDISDKDQCNSPCYWDQTKKRCLPTGKREFIWLTDKALVAELRNKTDDWGVVFPEFCEKKTQKEKINLITKYFTIATYKIMENYLAKTGSTIRTTMINKRKDTIGKLGVKYAERVQLFHLTGSGDNLQWKPDPKLKEMGIDPLSNFVLVIDEAHKMFQTELGLLTEAAIKYSYRTSPPETAVRVILLTATPIPVSVKVGKKVLSDVKAPMLFMRLLNMCFPNVHRSIWNKLRNDSEKYGHFLSKFMPSFPTNWKEFQHEFNFDNDGRWFNDTEHFQNFLDRAKGLISFYDINMFPDQAARSVTYKPIANPKLTSDRFLNELTKTCNKKHGTDIYRCYSEKQHFLGKTPRMKRARQHDEDQEGGDQKNIPTPADYGWMWGQSKLKTPNFTLQEWSKPMPSLLLQFSPIDDKYIEALKVQDPSQMTYYPFVAGQPPRLQPAQLNRPDMISMEEYLKFQYTSEVDENETDEEEEDEDEEEKEDVISMDIGEDEEKEDVISMDIGEDEEIDITGGGIPVAKLREIAKQHGIPISDTSGKKINGNTLLNNIKENNPDVYKQILTHGKVEKEQKQREIGRTAFQMVKEHRISKSDPREGWDDTCSSVVKQLRTSKGNPSRDLEKKQAKCLRKQTKIFSPNVLSILKNIRRLDEQDQATYQYKYKHAIFTEIVANQSGTDPTAKYLGAPIITMAFNAFGINYISENSIDAHIAKWGYKLVEKGVGAFELCRISNESKCKDTEFQTLPLQYADYRKNDFCIWLKHTFYAGGTTKAKDKDAKLLAKLKGVYNNALNKHGDIIRFVIIDYNRKEGLDLFDTIYMHITSLPTSETSQEQIVGRIRRRSGHCNVMERFDGYQNPATGDDYQSGWFIHVYVYEFIIPERFVPQSIKEANENKRSKLRGIPYKSPPGNHYILGQHIRTNATTELTKRLANTFEELARYVAVDRQVNIPIEWLQNMVIRTEDFDEQEKQSAMMAMSIAPGPFQPSEVEKSPVKSIGSPTGNIFNTPPAPINKDQMEKFYQNFPRISQFNAKSPIYKDKYQQQVELENSINIAKSMDISTTHL